MTPEPQKPPFDQLDLRSITRSQHSFTNISVDYEYKKHLWIRAGEVELSKLGTGEWNLRIRCKAGWTDFEHDSASAVLFGIIGLSHDMTFGGVHYFSGWISPQNHESFRVPQFDYDPLKNSKTCTRCEEHHPLVEYTPGPNRELYRLLAGRKIEVYTGPVTPNEDA